MDKESLDGHLLVIGTKQTLKAAQRGELSCVIIAKDVESALLARLLAKMLECSLEPEFVPTMKELGARCGIEVGCAIAGVRKDG